MKAIPIKDEIERFKTHLSQNERVIFSARFGDGKTYFLKEAKKKLSKDHYFITIYPINYSVAVNEDIFEYIKRDILIQLANDNKLEYNKIDLDALGKSICNLDNLKQVASVIFEAAEISSSRFEKATKFLKKIKDHYEGKKVLFSDYVKTFKSQRGGIYEDDAYTGLIKQALNIIQGHVDISSGKRKCVLIIEDLDRIDPGHLFRILNVFGAHMDLDQVKNNKEHNKFGFDNIIVVMDYETTRHIFYHFYGTNANYEGYMSKYFSHYPFSYSVTEAARKDLEKIILEKCNVRVEDLNVIRYGKSNDETIKNLIKRTSIRDIARVIDNYEHQVIKKVIPIKNNIKISTYNSFSLLLSIIFILKPEVNLDELRDSILMLTNPLTIIGPFLVKSEPSLLDGNLFIYNEKKWQLRYQIDKQSNIIKGCNFISQNKEKSDNNNIEYDIQPSIIDAFRIASEYVKDLG